MKQRTERGYKNLANKREKSLTWISITDERAFETAVFEMRGTNAPGNYCCFFSSFAPLSCSIPITLLFLLASDILNPLFGHCANDVVTLSCSFKLLFYKIHM